MNGNYLCLYSRMRVRHFSICLIYTRARAHTLLAYKKKMSHFSHFSHLNFGVRSVGCVG